MISIAKKIYNSSLLFVVVAMVLGSCNKDLEQLAEPAVTTPSGLALGDFLATRANDSLYYRMVERGGQLPTVNNKATSFTMIVPDNNAMKVFVNAASGGAIPLGAPDAVFSAFIKTTLPVASAAGVVMYNILPQAVPSASIPNTFPNFQYPSILNPAPTISAFLRLTTFLSSRNGLYVNNVPITVPDIAAANGYLHEVPAIVLPPTQYLWDRISADPGLTYLKAAIIRADSGTVTPGTLVGALQNIGANLTVYAPTDAAFQATLYGAIYQALVAMGVPPATAAAQAAALSSSPTVFSNPALYSVLTAQTVQGIVVYHILGSRAFNNNLPTTQAYFPTLLNGAIPAHPGVGLTSVFTGPSVSSATVKGVGNATAANILINPTPAPNGTSDQHYLNGVLHKIDQVLLPQ